VFQFELLLSTQSGYSRRLLIYRSRFEAFGELIYGLKLLQVIADQWVRHYNTERTHGSLGHRLTAPQAWVHAKPA
jgi:transposase InsO family protein